ncbi:MAG: hypothetical protein CSA81_03035, partial [Acidobacteria bacterium]
ILWEASYLKICVYLCPSVVLIFLTTNEHEFTRMIELNMEQPNRGFLMNESRSEPQVQCRWFCKWIPYRKICAFGFSLSAVHRRQPFFAFLLAFLDLSNKMVWLIRMNWPGVG